MTDICFAKVSLNAHLSMFALDANDGMTIASWGVDRSRKVTCQEPDNW
jgi:hypothetical protein